MSQDLRSLVRSAVEGTPFPGESADVTPNERLGLWGIVAGRVPAGRRRKRIAKFLEALPIMGFTGGPLLVCALLVAGVSVDAISPQTAIMGSIWSATAMVILSLALLLFNEVNSRYPGGPEWIHLQARAESLRARTIGDLMATRYSRLPPILKRLSKMREGQESLILDNLGAADLVALARLGRTIADTPPWGDFELVGEGRALVVRVAACLRRDNKDVDSLHPGQVNPLSS